MPKYTQKLYYIGIFLPIVLGMFWYAPHILGAQSFFAFGNPSSDIKPNERFEIPLMIKDDTQELYGTEFVLSAGANMQYEGYTKTQNSDKVLIKDVGYGKEFTILQNKQEGPMQKDTPILHLAFRVSKAGSHEIEILYPKLLTKTLETLSGEDQSKSVYASLSQVQDISHEQRQDNLIKLIWNHPNNDSIDYYEIYRKNGSQNFVKTKELVNPYSYESLYTEGSYTFKVLPVSGDIKPGINNAPAITYEYRDTKAPNVPQNLALESTPDGLELTFDASIALDLQEYQVFKQSGTGGQFTQISSIQNNYFLDSDVQMGTNYSYYVKATDDKNNVSKKSATVQSVYRITQQTQKQEQEQTQAETEQTQKAKDCNPKTQYYDENAQKCMAKTQASDKQKDTRIPDWWYAKYELDANQAGIASADTDGDNLSNFEEYRNNTHPRKQDTDGDGYSDGFEVAAGSDPLDPERYPKWDPSDLPENFQKILEKRNLGNKENETQVLRSLDSDGDGLSDEKEAMLGTDPNKVDTDGDGLSDGDEVLVYDTNPLEFTDKEKLFVLLEKPKMSSLQKNSISADSKPVFKGFYKPGSKVRFAVKYEDTSEEVSIGSQTIGENGVFFIKSEKELRDAPLRLVIYYGKDKKIISKHILTINSQLQVKNPEFLLFNGKKIDPDTKIITSNKRPKVSGQSYYGAQIHATWQSLVSSSNLISDANSGYFEIRPPRNLKAGTGHTLSVYTETSDGVQSKTAVLPFYVKESTESQGLAANLFGSENQAIPAFGALLLSLLLSLSFAFIIVKRKKNLYN